jgi:hypothetical protein
MIRLDFTMCSGMVPARGEPMRTTLVVFSLFSVMACGGSTTSGANPAEAGTSTGTASTSGGSPVSTPSLDASVTLETECVSEKVSWHREGGRVAYTDFMSLQPCNTFRVERSTSDSRHEDACYSELDQCKNGAPDPGLGTCHVSQALRHPDVVAAFAKGGGIYGKDDRPCDGSLLQIEIGGKSVFVGGDCNAGEKGCGGTPCNPVPAGLRSLATVLEKVGEEGPKRPGFQCIP